MVHNNSPAILNSQTYLMVHPGAYVIKMEYFGFVFSLNLVKDEQCNAKLLGKNQLM